MTPVVVPSPPSNFRALSQAASCQKTMSLYGPVAGPENVLGPLPRRLISWQSVAGGFVWRGTIWSGIALVFGYLVIRSRQLASYSGHG